MRSGQFIVLDHVCKSFTQGRIVVPVLCSVNLVVNRGDFVVIAGRPGSGKSTLLNVMAGLTTPTSGQVLYDGVEVWAGPDPERSRFRTANVGFVFQFPSLMPSLTVLENVLLSTMSSSLGTDAGERTRMGMELLGEVGLADRLGAYPRQLSAGQQQQLVLARALIGKPEVLFADEPTSGLTPQAADEMMALFQHIRHLLGVTIVLVTPSLTLTACGARHLQLHAGRLVETALVGGPPNDATGTF